MKKTYKNFAYTKATENLPYTITSGEIALIRDLVIAFTNAKIPFKVVSLPAGVKVFTTETAICPCCKRII